MQGESGVPTGRRKQSAHRTNPSGAEALRLLPPPALSCSGSPCTTPDFQGDPWPTGASLNPRTLLPWLPLSSPAFQFLQGPPSHPHSPRSRRSPALAWLFLTGAAPPRIPALLCQPIGMGTLLGGGEEGVAATRPTSSGEPPGSPSLEFSKEVLSTALLQGLARSPSPRSQSGSLRLHPVRTPTPPSGVSAGAPMGLRQDSEPPLATRPHVHPAAPGVWGDPSHGVGGREMGAQDGLREHPGVLVGQAGWLIPSSSAGRSHRVHRVGSPLSWGPRDAARSHPLVSACPPGSMARGRTLATGPRLPAAPTRSSTKTRGP